jgi:hypothetical protein
MSEPKTIKAVPAGWVIISSKGKFRAFYEKHSKDFAIWKARGYTVERVYREVEDGKVELET